MLKVKINNISLDLLENTSISVVEKNPVLHTFARTFSYPFSIPITQKNAGALNLNRLDNAILKKRFKGKIYISDALHSQGEIRIKSFTSEVLKIEFHSDISTIIEDIENLDVKNMYGDEFVFENGGTRQEDFLNHVEEVNENSTSHHFPIILANKFFERDDNLLFQSNRKINSLGINEPSRVGWKYSFVPCIKVADLYNRILLFVDKKQHPQCFSHTDLFKSLLWFNTQTLDEIEVVLDDLGDEIDVNQHKRRYNLSEHLNGKTPYEIIIAIFERFGLFWKYENGYLKIETKEDNFNQKPKKLNNIVSDFLMELDVNEGVKLIATSELDDIEDSTTIGPGEYEHEIELRALRRVADVTTVHTSEAEANTDTEIAILTTQPDDFDLSLEGIREEFWNRSSKAFIEDYITIKTAQNSAELLELKTFSHSVFKTKTQFGNFTGIIDEIKYTANTRQISPVEIKKLKI